MDFILKEIDKQQNGLGTRNKVIMTLTDGVSLMPVSESDYYWVYGVPGFEIDSTSYKSWSILNE